MSGLKSNIDKDFRSKGSKSLSSFKELKVNNKTFEKYRDQGIILSDLTGLDDSEFGRIFVDKDDKLVGYVICNDWGWITSIEVTPDYKGYGLGEQLLKYAMKNLGGNRLGVHKDNEVAYRLYKKNGFYEVSAKSIGGSGEKGMIFMTTDKNITEDCLEESDSLKNKLISNIIDSDLSNAQKIDKLQKLREKFESMRKIKAHTSPNDENTYVEDIEEIDKEIKKLETKGSSNKEDLKSFYKSEKEYNDMIEYNRKLLKANETLEAPSFDIINKLNIPEARLINIAKNTIEDVDLDEDWAKGKKFGLIIYTGLGRDLIYCFDNKKFYDSYHQDPPKESDGKSYNEIRKESSMSKSSIQEVNYVYKAAEFGLTRPLSTGINTINQHKLINAVLKNDKLSNKEKIVELRKLKTKFKNVKTWRVNHGNLVPVVDKEIKKKICDTALNKIDKEIEKLGGTIKEDFTDMYGELNESTINILNNNLVLQEVNDGKDDEYASKVKKILDKDTKNITKEDIVELDKNLKAIKNNHKKADIKLLILVGLAGGLVGALSMGTLTPAATAATVYMQTLINFGELKNPDADKDLTRISNNIERASKICTDKIIALKKKEDLTADEKATLKELNKMSYKLVALDQKLKRATYFNMKEEVEEQPTPQKRYLYESISEKSLNSIIM